MGYCVRWFYNEARPHQALGNATPQQWYRFADSYGGKPAIWETMQARPVGKGATKLQGPASAPSDPSEEF